MSTENFRTTADPSLKRQLPKTESASELKETLPRPFLSIVTISFNQAVYLRQAVESVLNQKTTDIEYIVVDPGSTDGSREILSEYSNTIDHIVFEPDQGPADGLNKGFALASGTIGYFLNSDDFLLPGATDRLRFLWANHPATDLLLCGAWMVNDQGMPIRELRSRWGTLKELLDGRTMVVQQGMSFRMDRFRELGGFNSENRTCWDYELLCRLAQLGATTAVSRERVAAFRIHNANISKNHAAETLSQSYRDDIDSIHRALTGRPSPPRRSKWLLRGRRLVAAPLITLTSIRDHFLPNLMRRRWLRDLGMRGR